MPHQDIRLTAADGYPLAATVYPAQDGAAAGDWIVFGSATAVPRQFYRRFAEFAQARGVSVLTVDYRGIGGSRPVSGLRGFSPAYEDWSRLDLACAVDYCADRGPTYLVGHSLAGHGIGQLPNHQKLRAAYVCAAGAGWHGWMPRSEQIRVWFLWNVIGPVCMRLLGYQPMKALGMGEDLPASVFVQWRYWCRFPHYFFDAPDQRSQCIAQAYAAVTVPIAACNATDDLWALPASRDAFFKGYTSACVEPITYTPQQLGVAQVGHMGYFRESVGRVLWPQALEWLRVKGLRVVPPMEL